MTNPVSPVSAEALPCPHCGSTNLMIITGIHRKPVSCNDCLASAPSLANWNRRAPAASGAKVPGFLVKTAERAIHDATHKKGMQTNGPCMATIEVSHLNTLLRYAMAAAPILPNLNEVKP